MDAAKIDLGSAKLGSLMVALSIPNILAQAVNVAYSIVDRVYIGHIKEAGSLALTGVGLTFPIVMIVSATALLVGRGGAPLLSMQLGKLNYDKTALVKARDILGTSVSMLAVFSLAITIGFTLGLKPILVAFGASKSTLPYASSYLKIYLLGTIAAQLSLGLNPYISAQGRAKTAMASVLIGALLNMILDPIFIFKFNMGVKGAALATDIAQVTSSIWVIQALLSKGSPVRLEYICLKLRELKEILALGVSTFIMQVTESAIFVVLNRGLVLYGGDIYVATMTVLQSLMQLCFVPIQGFTQGVQPIISYNYGARNIPRVKKTILSMTLISTVATTLAYILIVAFRRFLIGLFTINEELISVASKELPIYFGAMCLFGIQMGAQNTFVGLGMAIRSLFIACLRKLILLIPLALVLPIFMGVQGIFYSEPIASTTSALTSLALLIICYRRL